MSNDVKYMTEQIQRRLVGATIQTALKSEDNESFGFRVVTRSKSILDVWVDCDAEGNGQGWLAIIRAGKV